MNISITTWPVVQSVEQADSHDHNHPALVAVPGHLVRPITMMIEKLFSLDAVGTIARGIEMQLVGLAEPDASCVRMGIRDASSGVGNLDGATDVEGFDDPDYFQNQKSPSRPHLTVIQGGNVEPERVEAGDDSSLELA